MNRFRMPPAGWKRRSKAESGETQSSSRIPEPPTGGGGKTFVRDVKNYVKQYLGDQAAVPPQHVIVYDEAQRAWDVERVAAKHALPFPVSEPEAFVGFGERIPEWESPEIHVGEEAANRPRPRHPG